MAPNSRGQTALITGASTGIGLELARCFAADGWDLVLVARDEAKLKSVADELAREYSVTTTVLATDLSRAESPQKIFDEIKNQNLQITCLVNNAGFGDYGFFAECDLEKQEEIIAVNIAALTKLTRLFLPSMIENKNGKILNVASTAGFFPGPLMSVYYATKAYVVSFSQALSNELQNSGVTCTCLCPGPTKSDFQSRAAMHKSRLMEGEMMSAQLVAQSGYRACVQGKTLCVPGAWNRILINAPRFLPRGIFAQLIRRAQEMS